MKPTFLINMFVTYALYSLKFDKIYVGYTSDLIDRFNSHNFNSQKGFTKNFRPWVVIYVEFHESKPAAMKREKELKSSRRRDFVRKQIDLVGRLSVS
jgi:putative endonuclease